ncbi:Eco57I restriction-modification methylase domain-containing protein [Flavobacterium sp. LHD-85]|uniref:HsdM family class I SAM-dependent methyltransferase n=1 Tax=Flavobacterium sp. LHD-85 TaxID=3071410 RepID=UPI0027E10265|nr:N-6 DNA methylase [Flavobacterium sp. LHD-85]MDQ6531996.1 N-6 DNA methylase [Flavobacterium sp. LHD-85]
MDIETNEYISGLSQLEMLNADGNSFGLIRTCELDKANINYYQRLSLEKAKKVGADAVYFRNFPNLSSPPKPQLYIFDFTVKEQDVVEIHKNVWSSTEVRLYLVITKSEIKFFNSSKPVEQTKSGDLQVSPFETLKIVGDAVKKYKEYSAKKFDNGSFWEQTQYDFGYGETAYEKLISQLKITRDQFLDVIKLDKTIASKLLVLGILVKYLEERVDVDENGKETRVFATDFFNQEKFGFSTDFTETIRKGNQYTLNLFEYLSNHFNGKIFYLSDAYKEQIKVKDLSPLADFLSGVLDKNQFVFWRLYSFNYLPIELISSIYEMFLEADNSTGVAYTPSYLVSFMIDECMPINHPKENFKILDPACGSGIFLVSAYKRIIDWWRVSNYEKTGEWFFPGKENLSELKSLLKDSVYGIDISNEAVDLAIFSLSLTLCDILSPKVIWENLRFDDLSNNVVGEDFFDWYPKNIDKKFDLIIGNPPFIEYGVRETKINSVITGLKLVEQVPNNQSALLFTIIAMNLLKKEIGLLSFILPSGPLLYNNSQKPINFRKWLFAEYNIPQIIDFTYLSNTLFKNKGNEKNVAVSAFFLENKVPDKNPIYHITVKKLKTAKERQYFEIDHYDFHKVGKTDALDNPFIWKSNLLGGGRLVPFINRLTSFQSLKDFLDQRKKKGWIYGDGFIKGKKDEELVESDFEKKKGGYSEADYLMDLDYVEPEYFSEKGIEKTEKNTSKYFQWPRNEKIFEPPLLLIKKNIGSHSIPVFFSDLKLGYKNEIIGIHSPLSEREELKNVYFRIKDNPLYRFYILATSARSGVSRSTKTTLQKDILGIPFPEYEEEIELTQFDKILINDTLDYGLEFLGKDNNVKALEVTTEKDLNRFAETFAGILNSLFETKAKKYLQKSIYQTESFICSIFEYGDENNIIFRTLKTEIEIENHISELVYNKIGTSYRINRVVKIYDGDLIYLIKPKELRYWLQSIALRDADETIVDLYYAGY